MKLVSFDVNGAASYGIAVKGGIIDAGARMKSSMPDLRAALTAEGLARLRSLCEAAPDHGLERVTLLPVIPNPRKILCIGINYLSHIKETGRPMPTYPMIFTRFAESQVGAGQPMIRPPESEQFDFEGELAVVIGAPGRRIVREDALKHVAGYACYNDGSIRDWQRHTAQFTPGKNFVGTGAFGPWLVTADEIPDPTALELTTRLNGEEMQRGVISDLVFDVPTLIAYLSTFTPLSTGDVIITGTTGGVGAFRKPPVWMKHGDVVEVEISGIGVLRNPIIDEGRAR